MILFLFILSDEKALICIHVVLDMFAKFIISHPFTELEKPLKFVMANPGNAQSSVGVKLSEVSSRLGALKT